MGRIQRKKTSHKKKKQNLTPTAESMQEVRSVEKTTALPSVSSKATTNRQVSPQRKPAGAIKPASVLPVKGFIDKALQFLREVKIELKKVTWPTRKQTFGSTAVVILLVIIISFFLGIVDMGLKGLIRVVLN